jgi:hypothetical protein
MEAAGNKKGEPQRHGGRRVTQRSKKAFHVIPAQAGIFLIRAGFHHEDTKLTKKGTKFF